MRMKKLISVFWVALAVLGLWSLAPGGLLAKDMTREPVVQPEGTEVATLAGGCFWCVEASLEKLDGVVEVVSGYAGGNQKNPTYEDVSWGRTQHLEAVQVFYDPKKTSYAKVVDAFFRLIDPTDGGGSFVDRGAHYRSAVFYHSKAQEKVARAAVNAIEKRKIFDAPVVTEIRPFDAFYPAENYHQDFYEKSPGRYYPYRRGSGRDAFIEKHWKDVPPLVSATPGS